MATQTDTEIHGKTEDGRRIFNAAILTGYLAKDMEAEGRDPEYIKKQIEKFGYDPNNFSGLRHLDTDKFRVMLETSDNHKLLSPVLADVAIAGCTEETEAAISEFMGSGLVVARYSIFYGNPSKYTGVKPEDAGYSIDIPKKVSTARAMLTDDRVLEALLARDEIQIMTAIAELNEKLEQPILVTKFLEKALEVKR